MKAKKIYEAPEIDIQQFEVEDIIAASGDFDGIDLFTDGY